MDKIIIDVGVHTALSVDLTKFDFTGVKKLIMTVKNYAQVGEPVVLTREFTESIVYGVCITPEESLALKVGAVYDFDEVLEDGTQYKVGDNGQIELRRGCGECQ